VFVCVVDIFISMTIITCVNTRTVIGCLPECNYIIMYMHANLVFSLKHCSNFNRSSHCFL